MAVGLGLMRLPPCVFWAMTPREFSCAAASYSETGLSVGTPDRCVLNALQQRFPDQKGVNNG
jgi:uncharacterized phage protein (TIGR02216 family)